MIILKTRFSLVVFIMCFILFTPTLFSKEIILINPPQSKQDFRSNYSKELIQMAMKKTESLYGAFKIEYAKKSKWERAKYLLDKGKSLHVIQAATRPHWENDLIPIRIPIMKGLLGYRILLIKKQTQEKFKTIKDISELKSLYAGLGHDWSITTIFEENNFNIIKGSRYEGLFGMLEAERFDYFPRGINEIFTEYEKRKDKYPDMHIEDSLLLYLPLPVYLFVTPRKPELAKRIEVGLNLMIKDGSFNDLFYKYHRDILDKISLSKRKIFEIKNENLNKNTPFDRKELWLDFNLSSLSK